jgi:hypothetical protein
MLIVPRYNADGQITDCQNVDLQIVTFPPLSNLPYPTWPSPNTCVLGALRRDLTLEVAVRRALRKFVDPNNRPPKFVEMFGSTNIWVDEYLGRRIFGSTNIRVDEYSSYVPGQRILVLCTRLTNIRLMHQVNEY